MSLTAKALESRQRPSRPSRRPIPPQTLRELWARSAGRCEFRGCNEPLYRDTLTQARANLAHISHIVAWSPGGPRGDLVRSPLLARDISNLMLTCRKHGKVIDDPALVANYPESLLLAYKLEHELRIRMLTEVTEDSQTHVLLLQAPIDSRRSFIDPAAAFRAILPRYSAEEEPMRIDLTGMRIPTTTDSYFRVAAECITQEWQRCSSGRTITRVAVFALAPVPLLIHFGHLLGDLEHVDLYQRHRDSQDWTWKRERGERGEEGSRGLPERQEATAATAAMQEGDDVREVLYDVLLPETPDDGTSPIAVVLSVSASIGQDEVHRAIGAAPRVYEIRARSPGLDFLASRKHFELFGYEFRKLLEVLYEPTAQPRIVHLFAAVPAPVAIEFARAIKPHHPPFLVYEFDKAGRARIPALAINDPTGACGSLLMSRNRREAKT